METVTGELYTGRATVGTTAVQLTSLDYLVAEKGIQIFADDNNSDSIYVGDNESVTANASDTTDGFPILPGTSILVPIRHPSRCYVISGTAAQTVWWMIV